MKIPINKAKEILNQFELDQVIIFGWEGKSGIVQTATYGKTKDDCSMAKNGVNKIMKLWGLEKINKCQ